MFGRSGQMFPRRAYDDAMYEEEYGGGSSDSGEDCCRGRGVAGVLCWFFSVIILIGLASSVILTVFFVLKSRNLMGSSGGGGGGGGGVFDDLDLLYGFNHRNKFDKNDTSVMTTTEVTGGGGDLFNYKDSDFTSSKESHDERRRVTTRSSSPVTPAQPTRRAYGVLNRTPSPTTSRTTTKAITPSPTTTTTTSRPQENDDGADSLNSTSPRRISHLGFVERPPPRREEIQIDEGSNERWTPILPGGTSKMNHRPISSSSEENLSTTTHAHVLFSMPPTSNNVHVNNRRRPHRGPLPTSFSTSTEKLSDSLPAVIVQGQSGGTQNFTPSLNSTVPPPKPSRTDLLERIIKNLAPKFKNKTEIFSSHERAPPANVPNLRIKTTIRTRTPAPPAWVPATGFGEEVQGSGPPRRVGAFEVVEPPKFSREPSKVDNSSGEETGVMSSQEFMDILVGDEDEKRLVTKTTGSGLITSVILPTWYVNDTLTQNGTVGSGPSSSGSESVKLNATVSDVDKVLVGEEMTASGSAPSLAHAHRPTGLGQLLMDMFNPHHNSRPPPPPVFQEPNRVGTPSHVAQESNRRPSTSFKDLLKELAPVFPPSTFRPGNDDGGRVEFQEQEEEDGGQVTWEEETDQSDDAEEDEQQGSHSHVIEVAYDENQRPQIVVEPDGSLEHAQEEDGDATHVHHHHHHHDREPLNSASEIHPQIISPPPHFKIPIISTTSTSTTVRPPPRIEPIDPVTLEEVKVDDTNLIVPDENLQNVYAHGRPVLDGDEEDDEVKADNDEILRRNETAGQDEEPPYSETSPEISGEIRLPEDYNRVHLERNNEESRPNESSNFFLQRHPVSELDENLFSQGPSFQILPPPVTKSDEHERPPMKRIPGIMKERIPGIMKEQPKVHKVFSIIYPTTTTTTTTTTTQQPPPYQNSNSPANNSSGFNPPELIDFHSNVHSFKPSVVTTSSGFTPLGSDSWRPVVYEEENQYAHAPASRYPQSMGPSSSFERGSTYGKGGNSVLPGFSQALKLRPTSTGSEFDQSREGMSGDWLNRFTNPAKATTKPPIVPSQPIPPPPLVLSPPSRVKFPTVQEEAAAQQAAAAVIDRAKYLHRPAPPPILMRRTPQQPHRPGRHKNLRNPPYMSQQQQIQQQRMLKERLYHQHMTRMRNGGGGNIQWPNEEQPIRRNG